MPGSGDNYERPKNLQYEKLLAHIGHKLTVADYGDGEELAVECEDCHTVLYTEEDEEEDRF